MIVTGIAWDHIRGFGPMKAAVAELSRTQPGVDYRWEVRSLKDFGDLSMEQLSSTYDLILFDHPFVGDISKNKLLIPLDEWLPASFLDKQRDQSVGPSFESYAYDGHLWGLPVDAAAQVAAYRSDILEKHGKGVPKSWGDVFRLASDLPVGVSVGLPMDPTSLICSFLTLCAARKESPVHDDGTDFDEGIAVDALSHLKRLSTVVPPDSFETNPIALLNRMSSTDEVAYCPLVFGYSNYSRNGFALKLIEFANTPTMTNGRRGSILGGVGIGISAVSQFKEQCIEFVLHVCSSDFQVTTCFDSGGQPAAKLAWQDGRINTQANSFFRNTIDTLELSYVRPRYSGYNQFQERAGELIWENFKNDGDIRELYKSIDVLYRQYRSS